MGLPEQGVCSDAGGPCPECHRGRIPFRTPHSHDWIRRWYGIETSVWFTFVPHPLPLPPGTVRVWHANTYRLETTLNYGLERVWFICQMRGSNDVAIGYDEGSVMIKVGIPPNDPTMM